MRLTVLWCLVAASVGLTACVSKKEAPSPVVDTEAKSQAIINGQLDTTHQAVVALIGRNSICSGTIVQTDPQRGIGWVLTAAHCVDDVPQAIIQGNDFNSFNTTQYQVIDAVAHPAYDQRDTTFDFAVVRFAGASANTPVIPAATNSDGVGRGTPVTSVGYGRTTPSNRPSDNNTQRRRFNASISQTNNLLLVYSLANGGICSGDSGGPVLANVNGVETVVGVHSSVTGDCTGDGFSGRVSGVFSTWLTGELGGEVEESCELCRQVAQTGDGACTGTIDDCFDNQACSQFVNCINNCNTDACINTCVENNSEGVRRYQAIFDCICEDACPEVCAGDPSCPEGPACGIGFQDQTCGSCSDGSCCAQSQACSEDDTCLDCISGNASAAVCNNNAAFNAFFGCLENSCGDQCGLNNECGFAIEGACGVCLENDCCAEGAACVDDPNCLDCAGGEGENCASNVPLNNLLECLGTCQGDPCEINGDDPGNNDPNNNPNNDGNNDDNNNPFNPNTNNDGNNDANNDGGNGGFVGDNNGGGGFTDNGDGSGFTNSGGTTQAACATTLGHGPAAPAGALVLMALGMLIGWRRRR